MCEGFRGTVCQPHKVTTREHVHGSRWPFRARFSPNFEDICATLLQDVGNILLLVAHGHHLRMFQTRTVDMARELGQRSSSSPNQDRSSQGCTDVSCHKLCKKLWPTILLIAALRQWLRSSTAVLIASRIARLRGWESRPAAKGPAMDISSPGWRYHVATW